MRVGLMLAVLMFGGVFYGLANAKYADNRGD